MASRSRESIMKRVRENKRREKAARKRERRLERKQSKNAPEGSEFASPEDYMGLEEGPNGLPEDAATDEELVPSDVAESRND